MNNFKETKSSFNPPVAYDNLCYEPLTASIKLRVELLQPLGLIR